jgi:transposase-like protein
MKMERTHYSKEFKLKVVEEVLRGEITKEEARRKYGLRAKSGVLSWMRKFEVSGYRQIPDCFERMKEEQTNDSAELKKRIKQLERALKDAELKAEGYSRMIDIAERELNIGIRKKSSAKQSGK